MKRAVEKREVVRAKTASIPAVKIVTETLTRMTEQVRTKYAAEVASHYVSSAERFVDQIQRDEQFINRRKGGANARFADSVLQAYGTVIRIAVDTVASQDRTKGWTDSAETYKLKLTYKSRCKKAGDDASYFMQQEFLQKNVWKLSKILEEKSNLLGDPVILSIRAQDGTIQGDIRFHFADGSRFTVRNKIILKYSIHNKPFNQYPTTFHDAILPTGKTMHGQPSEEEMVTIFATAKARR